MYLHTLSLQAIGPFAGRHRIDVARLAASGLFLLEGPTGAGKSTLIDAVTFALYGKVASEAASDDRLRSAFVPPEVESFVDLIFETPSGVYRVRRTPEYQRPKKRGTGTTTQQASVMLWRLGGVPESGENGAEEGGDADVDGPPGELLSSRLDEAGEEIRRIIGLDRRQFVQTVVLPQGEFARFLRADPEERGKLLQRVFGTELYDRIAARLADLRKAALRTVDGARVAVTGAVEHFVGASGIDAEDAAGLRAAVESLENEPGEVHDRALGYVAELDGSAASLKEAQAAAEAAHAVARDRAAAAGRLLDDVRRRAELTARSLALADREPEIEDLRRRLAAHGRAAAVAALADGARTAARAVEEAVEQRALARAGLPEPVIAAGPAGWEAWQDQIAAASARLTRLQTVGAGLPAREQRAADARKELELAAEGRARMAADLAERPALRAELEATLRSCTQVASAAPAAEERLARARAVAQAAEAVAALSGEMAAAEAARDAAAGEAQAAVRTEAELRTARIAGIAGELAESLVDGEPCPVCGSARHPAPARRDADHVGATDVAAAERHRGAAERELRETATRVAALTERIEAERRASGGIDPAVAAQAVADAQRALSAAEEAATERDIMAARLATVDAETAALTQEIGRLAETIAARRVEVADLEAALLADRAEIDAELDAAGPLLGIEPDAAGAVIEGLSATAFASSSPAVAPSDGPEAPCGGPADSGRPEASSFGGSPASIGDPVAALRIALRERSAALAALTAAESAVTVAQRAAAVRREELAKVVHAQGFADVEEGLAAVLSTEAREQAEDAVAAHEAARATVTEGLAELADLPDRPVADVRAEADTALADAEVAEAAAREAARLHGFAEHTLAAARSAADAVGRAVAAWAAARDASTPVTRMANLAAGLGSDNPQALSLATFVLVRRFQDVVAAANERLAEMSSGRYELAHTAAREAVRSRRTGLAMTVIDHVTERSRDPRTLSGGETFYVSLCLALGLADVVTAEAGGVELGTLFVDEGFGSLDPSTLDAVLGELGRLRDGGRVVGVVSHVDALKQTIAERIEVRPVRDGRGSTLTVRA